MKKVFGLVPLQCLLVSSASERGQPQRAAERTAVQDRSASQIKRRDFSVSKILGAPQLNDPTDWALPHLTLRRFTPPPTSARFPPLCLFCMGMPTPVGWRCSLYRPHLSLPLVFLSLTHALFLTRTNPDLQTLSKLMQKRKRKNCSWGGCSAENWISYILWKSSKPSLTRQSTPIKLCINIQKGFCRFSDRLCPYWPVFDVCDLYFVAVATH